MKYKNILVGILLVLVTTTIVFGNNNISLNNSLVNETIIDQVNIIEKVDSVEVDPIEIIEKSNFFVLSNNLIESSKVKEISPIELKEKSIKNKVKNGFKQKVEDLNINSKLIGCSLSTNLVCELEMSHNYKVYFITNDGEKLYPKSYEKNDNNYMITFDTKKEGVLHVGRHSDQYLIKNNFLFYSPSKVSKNVEFHGGVKGSGDLNGTYYFDGHDDFIMLDSSIVDNTQSFSIIGKFKAENPDVFLFAQTTGSNAANDIQLLYRNDGVLMTQLIRSNNYMAGFSDVLDLSSWKSIAVTFDGVYLNTYVNGIMVSSTNQVNNGNYPVGNPVFTMGKIGSAYYKFDAKDIKAYDKSLTQDEVIQSHDNVIVDGLIFELEPNSPSIDFDGVNDKLTVINDFLSSGDDISISLWAYWKGIGSSTYQEMVSFWDSSVTSGNRFYFGVSGGTNYIRLGDGTWSNGGDSNIVMPQNKWVHLTYTFDSTTKQIKLYKNGELAYSRNSNSNPEFHSIMTIGQQGVLTTEWFNGKLDNIEIYNKVISSEEVQNKFDSGRNSIVDEEASFYLDGKQLIDWSNTGYNLGAHNGIKIKDLKEAIYEDPKDSDLTSWSSSGEGTMQKTAGVIKASSYGSGSSWHGPAVEKNIEVLDGQTLSIKNTFTTTNDQMGKSDIILYDDAGDYWILSLADAWASELAIQTSIMNDVGANLYTNKDSGNSGHEFLWDVEVSNGKISFYIDNNLLTTDQMTGTKITSIKISMPAFSTYSISKAEINSIEIKKPNGGKAFNFDGVNDYFDLNRKISGNSQFSISTWYKLDADANGNQMIYEDSNTRLRVNPTGTSILIWKDRSATGSFDYIEGYIPKVNEYTHLTLVVDGDNYKLYKNGVEQSTTVSTSTTSSTSKNANIGRSADGNSYFKGSLVNFMMFNKPLTETEVTDLFTKGKEYDPSTIDNNILNETEARGAILEELDTSLGVYTYKEDRQVTVRLANGSQYHGRYDMYVSSGDKRYVINYDENETAVQPVVEGISPVLNVWQRVAKKASDFKDDLREFIGLNN